MRMGGHKTFLRLVLVDLVVHFAKSLSLQNVATLETGIPCGITPSSSSCIPLSHCKSQAVCCRERLRVILFDKIAILSSEQVLNCTNTKCFDEVSKYFCMERSLACPSRQEFHPYFDRRPSGSLRWKTRIVCPFWDFFLLGSIHFLVIECISLIFPMW